MATQRRANESRVWEHMDKKGHGKAECRLCARVLAYVGGSTSGLKQHLQTMHPDVVGEKKSQPTLSSFGVGPQRPCNDSRQEKITVLLTKVIVANMLPLSLVDSPGNAGFLISEHVGLGPVLCWEKVPRNVKLYVLSNFRPRIDQD